MGHAKRLPGYLDIVAEPDVETAMRDGTVLRADIYRPATGGPFPTILMRLPYDKTLAQDITYRHPSWYARHGYLVIVQDVRGRGRSDGDFYPFAHESDDGFESVEWAAALPQSNGRVGMYGFSYVGATQLQAALRRPPGLRAICPALTASQFYDGWTYNAGAFALSFNASWAINLARDGARRARDEAQTIELTKAFLAAPDGYGHVPLETYPPLATTEFGAFFFDWLAHPTYDDYWRRWSIDKDYARIDIPALHIGGWYDIFLNGTVKNFVGLRRAAASRKARESQKLLVGPWYHLPWTSLTGANDFGPAARNIVNDWQLRWFDQFLKEEDTGVLAAPVTVFLMGENRWIDLQAWPPPGTRFADYYLHSDGDANSINGHGTLSVESPSRESPDVYTYDPLAPTPSVGGRSCCFPAIAPMGPANQAPVETFNSVLVYTSRSLERPLTVIGPVTATLFAATTAADTDFTVKLCDVDPAGVSTNIQGGIMRARFRESLSTPTAIVPGEVYEYTVELGPTAYTFQPGHQIRVQVSSSDFPQWDRNLNTGGIPGTETLIDAVVATQFVLHDSDHPSCIRLPVADGI
ncbi:MAG: CocE/NonD family hydrolase [Chloroflexota bacterium]